MRIYLINRIIFFAILSFYSQMLFASNTYYIYSAVSANVVNPNSTSHEITISFRVAAVGDLSQNVRFGIKYKKHLDPDKAEYWHVGSVHSDLYQFSNLVKKDIVINGISITGNSGEYDFMICNVVGNQLIKLGSIQGYLSVQKVNLNFYNSQDDWEKLLGDITTALKGLETVSKGYGILFTEYDEDIKKEIKKTGNVIEWIGKAKDVISFLNDYKAFINEPDQTKQYLLIMKYLVSVASLPAPLSKVFSLYIDVAISFKDVIGRLENNIGAAQFQQVPDDYVIKVKARKLKRNWWPDQYFDTQTMEQEVAHYYLDGYPNGADGNRQTVELYHDNNDPSNNGEGVILPLKGRLNDILNYDVATTKYSLRIQFENGLSVAIPFDMDFAKFPTIFSGKQIKVGVDIRQKDLKDFGKKYEITPMKASEL